MNGVREHIPAYLMLGVYTIVGVITRYYITYPCGSFFEDIHVSVSQIAIFFIAIGIGFGLYSFFCPKKPLTRVGQGIVTGLAVGFSGTTAVFLISNPCG